MVPYIGLYVMVLLTVFPSHGTIEEIYCPCGRTGLNFTRPYNSEVNCRNFKFCQSCENYLESCSSCPPGRAGRFCERSPKFDVTNTLYNKSIKRRKRSSNCPDFLSMKLVDITCWKSRYEKECTGKCVIGHQFIGHGGDEMVLKCVNGRYTPLREFPECESKGLCDVEMEYGGSYNCTTGSHGTTCYVFCHPDYNGMHTCIPGQAWRPPLPHCIKHIRPHAPCHCKNNGRCEGPNCVCPIGYRGRLCEIEPTNVAVSCHCENGGRCEGPNCICKRGYRGRLCEIKPTNVAVPCHCENGGRCEGPNCICPRGYRGRLCEIEPTDVAAPCHCLNNGRCEGPHCVCPIGYQGRLCDIEPTEVATPCHCQNGGRCEGPNCICPRGYRGRLCEIAPTPAAVHCHCENGGHCIRGSRRCNCPQGYRGRNCEIGSPPKTIYCDQPDDIENGHRHNDEGLYKEGSVVTYMCDSGFNLRGKNSITCLITGQWSSRTPVCEGTRTTRPSHVKTCEEPGDISNGWKGILTTTFTVGSVVTYSCNSGYEISGERKLSCSDSGKWSAKKPTCILKEDKPVGSNGGQENSCSYIAPPVNSVVRLKDPSGDESAWSTELEPNANNQRFLVGSRIRYRCSSTYYEFYGSEYQTCQDGGTWSGTRPTCIPECGKSDTPRTPFLASGNATRIGQWPWQTAIYTMDTRTGKENFTCGGTLVNDRWTVTAAHCVTATRASKNVISTRLVSVYAGMYDRRLSKRDEQVQKKKVRQIVIHEEYDYVRFDSDIALIEFETPMDLTERVKPICLPTDITTRENIRDGKRGIVIGWGEMGHNKLSNELLEIVIPVVSHTKCEDSFREEGMHFTITKNMFCAGYDDGRADTCIGDSGGPMMFLDETQWSYRWIIEGIVSWGSENGCGAGSRYSGFTEVNKFTQWIKMFV